MMSDYREFDGFFYKPWSFSILSALWTPVFFIPILVGIFLFSRGLDNVFYLFFSFFIAIWLLKTLMVPEDDFRRNWVLWLSMLVPLHLSLFFFFFFDRALIYGYGIFAPFILLFLLIYMRTKHYRDYTRTNNGFPADADVSEMADKFPYNLITLVYITSYALGLLLSLHLLNLMIHYNQTQIHDIPTTFFLLSAIASLIYPQSLSVFILIKFKPLTNFFKNFQKNHPELFKKK